MSELVLTALENGVFANGPVSIKIKDLSLTLTTPMGIHEIPQIRLTNTSNSDFYEAVIGKESQYKINVEVMKRTAVLTWETHIVDAAGNKIELRECAAPDMKFHCETDYKVDINIEYDEAVRHFQGMWSSNKLYIRRGETWYEVWCYAFHRTNGMHGSHSHKWEWKHVTSS